MVATEIAAHFASQRQTDIRVHVRMELHFFYLAEIFVKTVCAGTVAIAIITHIKLNTRLIIDFEFIIIIF